MRKVMQFVGSALTAFVLVAGAVVLLGGVLVPRVAGATTYAVLADSMAPRYPKGTLMVVRPMDTISTGDIITYQFEPNDPMVVTHRVVGVGSTLTGEPRFTTRGDANEIADPVLVQPEQIRGVLWYAIPFAGFLVTALGTWREPTILAVAGVLTFYALYQLVRGVIERVKPAVPAVDAKAVDALAVAPSAVAPPAIAALHPAPEQFLEFPLEPAFPMFPGAEVALVGASEAADAAEVAPAVDLPRRRDRRLQMLDQQIAPALLESIEVAPMPQGRHLKKDYVLQS